ncbi:MAG: hypothetical protein [Enterobacter phage ENC9]|nr:MAG: hypothetical protein [Enterobacter phage ENC9]
MKDLVINLGDGSENDLEPRLYQYMTNLALEKGIEWAVENACGENDVAIGFAVYRVQWQFVGLECDDYEEVPNPETGCTEYKPVGEWYWEYGGPDFEVSCSWLA